MNFRFKAVPSHRIFWDYAFAGGTPLTTFSQWIVVVALTNGSAVADRRIACCLMPNWLSSFNLFCSLQLAEAGQTVGHHVVDYAKRRFAAGSGCAS
ncbi:hypothetical protein MJK72_11635 [Klebsiella pneumoniae]|nr:hypothetical protein MJK72_11635 [Klebsiella pneumoniae]